MVYYPPVQTRHAGFYCQVATFPPVSTSFLLILFIRKKTINKILYTYCILVIEKGYLIVCRRVLHAAKYINYVRNWIFFFGNSVGKKSAIKWQHLRLKHLVLQHKSSGILVVVSCNIYCVIVFMMLTFNIKTIIIIYIYDFQQVNHIESICTHVCH